MSQNFKQHANDLTDFLLEGHLSASPDAKLLAEAVLLGFAFHAEQVRDGLAKDMNSESIGVVLENILEVIAGKSSSK